MDLRSDPTRQRSLLFSHRPHRGGPQDDGKEANNRNCGRHSRDPAICPDFLHHREQSKLFGGDMNDVFSPRLCVERGGLASSRNQRKHRDKTCFAKLLMNLIKRKVCRVITRKANSGEPYDL